MQLHIINRIVTLRDCKIGIRTHDMHILIPKPFLLLFLTLTL